MNSAKSRDPDVRVIVDPHRTTQERLAELVRQNDGISVHKDLYLVRHPTDGTAHVVRMMGNKQAAHTCTCDKRRLCFHIIAVMNLNRMEIVKDGRYYNLSTISHFRERKGSKKPRQRDVDSFCIGPAPDSHAMSFAAETACQSTPQERCNDVQASDECMPSKVEVLSNPSEGIAPAQTVYQSTPQEFEDMSDEA